MSNASPNNGLPRNGLPRNNAQENDVAIAHEGQILVGLGGLVIPQIVQNAIHNPNILELAVQHQDFHVAAGLVDQLNGVHRGHNVIIGAAPEQENLDAIEMP